MQFEDSRPDEGKPIGDRIRDLINPALADDRRPKIQLDMLDRFFDAISEQFVDALESSYSDLFNKVASIRDRDENKVAPFIITVLTQMRNGRAEYTPVLQVPVPVANAFTDYKADEIKALPGYVKLHMKAREQNVSLAVKYVLSDEAKMGPPQPLLVIDGSKTYEQGAQENYNLYPNLPEPEKKFNPGKGGKFDL